jgi:hypothetical protein
MKQLKKWVKPVFWLGSYGCIFHGTGNSAQLCQNLRWGGVEPPTTPLGTPLYVDSLRTAFNKYFSKKFTWITWLKIGSTGWLFVQIIGWLMPVGTRPFVGSLTFRREIDTCCVLFASLSTCLKNVVPLYVPNLTFCFPALRDSDTISSNGKVDSTRQRQQLFRLRKWKRPKFQSRILLYTLFKRL